MLINNALVLGTFNRYNKNIKRSEATAETLASGKRINKAADDASGLSVTESFKAQIRGLSQGVRNTEEGISLLQVVDGNLEDIEKNLLRMKELSIQLSNGTYTDSDRDAAESEFKQLKNDIDHVSKTSEFNGIKLLSQDKKLTIQVKYEPYMVEEIELKKIDVNTLGLTKESIISRELSSKAVGKIDNALKTVIEHRETTGITLNRLNSVINDTLNAEVNTTASLSQIEDIDMAMATMNLLKNDVLVKYTNAMVAHANQDTNNVMQLIK